MARCNIGNCMGVARYVATWSWSEQKRFCGDCLPAFRLLATAIGEASRVRIDDTTPSAQAPPATSDLALAKWLHERRHLR